MWWAGSFSSPAVRYGTVHTSRLKGLRSHETVTASHSKRVLLRIADASVGSFVQKLLQ